MAAHYTDWYTLHAMSSASHSHPHPHPAAPAAAVAALAVAPAPTLAAPVAAPASAAPVAAPAPPAPTPQEIAGRVKKTLNVERLVAGQFEKALTAITTEVVAVPALSDLDRVRLIGESATLLIKEMAEGADKNEAQALLSKSVGRPPVVAAGRAGCTLL